MKVSRAWLQEYIKEPLPATSSLVETLSLHAFEIEGVEQVGISDRIVVGYVTQKQKHENADKLSVCRVDVGGEELQIVCGAANVAEGQKVPVALSGAHIGNIVIEKRELRGVVSEGMICSERELGLSDESDGIMVLPSDSVVGALVRDALSLTGDEVIDIDVLPNRAHDCLSHVGIAREVAMLFRLTFVLPEVADVTSDEVSTGEHAMLSIEDPKLVRRAMKRLVIDVKVGESPSWLKTRLEALGQKSKNTIVDITNFVTLETGQPVHAFDMDKVEGDITIRCAHNNEKVITLDGNEFELMEDDLVIADSEKALDIAGIKGSANSGIDENTTRVLLSVCNFDPVTIRRTSKRLGLKTDASKRFENEITPELTSFAMDRLTTLITELAGGKAGLPAQAGEVLDVYPRPVPLYKTGFSIKQLNSVLGTDLQEKEVVGILERLSFTYTKVTDPVGEVVRHSQEHLDVPYTLGASVLFDAPRTFDCSSFVAFLFKEVGVSLPRISVEQYLSTEPISEEELQPGDLLFGKGSKPYFYNETPEGIGHVGIYIGDGKVIHAAGSPESKVIVEEYATSPKFSGEEFRGFRRVFSVGKERFVVTVPPERLDLRIEADLIEEIGRVYGYNNIKATIPEVRKSPAVNKEFYYINKIRDILVQEGFWEINTYTFTEKGDVEVAKPINKEKPFLRTSLESNMHEVLTRGAKQKELLGLDAVKVFEIGKTFSGEEETLILAVGVVGKNAEEIAQGAVLKIPDVPTDITSVQPGIYEVNLQALINESSEPESYEDLEEINVGDLQFKPISSYPFVLRDIALWVPAQVESQEVLKVLKDNAGELLVNSWQFDEYKKDDQVSYAYRLVFQSHEKTLSDEGVNEIMDKVYKAVADKGWEVR